MHRVLGMAGAAMMAATLLVTPVSAQQSGNGSGSGTGTGGQTPSSSSQNDQGMNNQGTNNQQTSAPATSGGQGTSSSGSSSSGSSSSGSSSSGSSSQSSSGQGASGTQAITGPMTASGSCGYTAGNYGYTNISSANLPGETIPAVYYAVNYSNVPAPTTVGVIARYDGQLNDQTALQTFVAQSPNGTFENAIRANISPENQGGAAGSNSAGSNHNDPGGGAYSGGIDVDQHGSKDGPRDHEQPGGNGPTQGSGGAGVNPGNYVFYVYTGSTQNGQFVADEKNGYLGTFSCGVSTEQGSGPG